MKKAFIFIALFIVSNLIYAQGITTAGISGRVLDNEKEPLPGANVIAMHIPSGTMYGTTTRVDGRFNIPGMRVGGPYKVTASYVGFRSQTFDNVYLNLGVITNIDFKLESSEIELKELVVTADKNPIISNERTGAATQISLENIKVLPTVSSRITDYTRLTPQSKGSSFVGQDNRLNNITVDGSYFNNSFGLAGEPGDRTGVAPISLDAIEQIQVNIAPYDVRQGNFVGAGVNTVTRSGNNQYQGSIYWKTRNETFVGTKAAETNVTIGTFDYNLFGARISGPILKNQLFFFANIESDKVVEPGTTFRARQWGEPFGGNVTRVVASRMDSLRTFLKQNFGYETGPYQGYDHETPALRLSLRFDYNIDDRNKISLRYNHLDSQTDVLLSNSSSLGAGSRRLNLTGLNFRNSNYIIMENIRAIIGEWNSIITDNMTNNLLIGYRFHDESRKSRGTMFPFVDILEGSAVYTSFGFEPFTPNNELRYWTYQFQNNFSVFLPGHTLVFGLSMERYQSENIFFPGSQSVYVYNSLNDFYIDAQDYLNNPSRTVSPITLNKFEVRWSNIPGQTKPIQPLKVWYGGIYAQDEIEILSNLRVLAGLRVDVPIFEKTGYRNFEVDTMKFMDENGKTVFYKTDKLPDPRPLISPRLGFNFDVFGDKQTQLRGGTGIFTGQPAFVWISNQIGNNGILTGFERLTNTTNRPFSPDINRWKPATVSGTPASSYELSLTDPKFKFPQVWRTNIAVDQKLPENLFATIEYIYSSDVNGLYYINANLPNPNGAFNGPDKRPRWVGTNSNKIYSKVDNAIVLKNQNVGYSWNISAALEKIYDKGLYGKIGYSYGVSKNTVDPGSIASGSWQNNAHAGNPNNPGLSYSANTPDHRFFAALSYRLDYFNFGATTVSLFFDAYNVGRASYVYSADFNGDGGRSNDLIYIPKDKSEMNFQQYTVGTTTFTVQQQQDAWEAYIQQDKYLKSRRGKYAERNGVVLPMVARLDLSIAQEVYGSIEGQRNSLEIRLDIMNFTNLLNSDWGVSQSMNITAPLEPRGVDANGVPIFRLRNIDNQLVGTGKLATTFKKNASVFDVYRIQLGLRYNFN